MNNQASQSLENEIYEVLTPWAGIPTWYTGHPLDQNRFQIVAEELTNRFGASLNADAFEAALRRHANNTPTILGAPDDWEPVIKEFSVIVFAQ